MSKSVTYAAALTVAVLWLSACACHISADEVVEANPQSFDKAVKPFLTQHCIACHGEKKQRADRRLDTLTGEIANSNALADYQDILDQLNLGEMPPEEAPQPTTAARRQVIAWLTARIARYHAEAEPAARETVLRRLNGREYNNTLRDLLKLNMSIYNPAGNFPRERETHHLDNNGATLVTSGHLLDRYLAAAESAVERVIQPAEQPPVQTWTFTDGFRQQPEIDQVHRRTNFFKWMTLYEVTGADKHEGAYGVIRDFAGGVPHNGYYEIRVRAEALNRLHPYDPAMLGNDRSEKFRLGVRPGDHTAGELHRPQPVEPLLAEIELEDGEHWRTFRVWLDAGYTPRFTFENGPMEMRTLYSKISRRYKDQFPKIKRGGIVEWRYNVLKFGKMPQIRLHEIEIRGPLHQQWPTPSQQVLLGDDFKSAAQGKLSTQQLRSHLTAFASKAFRRPADREEIDRLMRLMEIRREAGRTQLQAYGDAAKAVLCSPAFLYLEETADQQNDTDLSQLALAARLSYLLWSSMPDETLLATARSGDLRQPEKLKQQVSRMLKDPRSVAFIEGFAGSWLTLRELGATPPDRGDFRAYYQYKLDEAMKRETHLFLRHLLDENLPVANCLDSDFTFVNRRLAEHYGMQLPPDVEFRGAGFQKVAVTDPRRGGLLGQASVLTVTANGVDTSPVTRGVWLLENLLGTPPSPPPPDVEPLDPDIRGAKTIRDQLAKHRENASCNDCHRKIDPPGFALENFDAIGGWRNMYPGRRKIDASGKWNGAAFNDIATFKKLLLERREQFMHATLEKLLAYATGRSLTPADRPAIDSIREQLIARGGGMRDLLDLVVTSEPFRSR